MVVDGYIHPVDASGNKFERRVMTGQQKKDYKNHHKETLQEIIHFATHGLQPLCKNCPYFIFAAFDTAVSANRLNFF